MIPELGHFALIVALGVALVVGAGIVLEGRDAGVEEGVVRFPPHHADRSLVELQAHQAIDA